MSRITMQENYIKSIWWIHVLHVFGALNQFYQIKPILTLKISVTNFWRFQYVEDFDIKFVLLDENNFEWIAFC